MTRKSFDRGTFENRLRRARFYARKGGRAAAEAVRAIEYERKLRTTGRRLSAEEIAVEAARMGLPVSVSVCAANPPHPSQRLVAMEKRQLQVVDDFGEVNRIYGEVNNFSDRQSSCPIT
jgi:hypothetical protein